MKDTLFVSHATPDDNEFAVWLATKLELCGYKVWVDVKSLDPSDDFWKKIDSTIREETVKFIFVMSASSVDTSREGLQKELAVADKIRKQDANFIVPIRINRINFDNLPIEVLRLNAIDFCDNWGEGLSKLIGYFEKEKIPKAQTQISAEEVLLRWKEIKASASNQIIDKDDMYYSNLFPIELPEYLYIYPTVNVEEMLKSRHIPYKKLKEVILTFTCSVCVAEWYGKEIIFERIKTSEAITDTSKDVVMLNQKISSLSWNVVELINWNIGDLFFKKGLRRFKGNTQKRSRNVYYFSKNTKSKRSSNSRVKYLSGKYKDKSWHYGISAYYVQYPKPGVMIRGHLVFTDANNNELPDSSQVAARRSKGKRFFNKEWKELLQTAIYCICDTSNHIYNTNCCEINASYLSQQPEMFIAHMGYFEPEKVVTEAEDFDE
ncbi:MAG: toll/interleukin-1 receptor domain-containing protein [Eubacteriales bacterium]